MRKLNICRYTEGKFTVTLTSPDYGAFPYEGTFQDMHYYYRVDTEEELLSILNKEDELIVSDIETIYYGSNDVTDKYLEFMDGSYRLKK